MKRTSRADRALARRRLVTTAAAVAAMLIGPGAARAVEGDGGIDGGSMVEITPELQDAVGRGLRYLAAAQQADGSYGQDRYGRHVGVASLAALAFMSNGDLPGRGEYGPNIERCLDFVLASAHPNGLFAADVSHGPMYGHGFATLFLAELYGQTNDDALRDALVKAVRLIIGSQNPDGGWRYQPVPTEADISVTICQVMALRASRNAGIKVPKETIDRAVEYVRRCQNADGGFRYMLNSGNSAFPRSAAGVATLYYAGIYEDDAIDKGLDYLEHELPGAGRSSPHYYYGHYYAVQAMFMAGGEHWESWFPAIRQDLINRQRADGSWEGQAGADYGTAMALIILQVPNRYLPIFEK